MRFGVVTQLAPLRVLIKGDTEPTAPTHVLGGATLAVGDEVTVHVVERRLIVQLLRPA